jgi:hypothetical protein
MAGKEVCPMLIDIHNEFRDSREGFSELEELAYLAYGDSQMMEGTAREYNKTDIAYVLSCRNANEFARYKVSFADIRHELSPATADDILVRLRECPTRYILSINELSQTECNAIDTVDAAIDQKCKDIYSDRD